MIKQSYHPNGDHPNPDSTPAQELLRAALAYAKRGYPVFPCRPDKSPFTQHGFKDATTDPTRIHAYWTRWPNANIGIPTGKASGIISLDLDVYEPGAMTFEEVVAKLGPLPKTATVRTGSGGLQLYYRYPAGEEIRNSASKLGAGIDVRGEGGYVIAPPSRTTGPYEWIERLRPADPPAWLLVALRKPPGKPERSTGERGPTSILAAGGKIPYRQRNDALASIAGRLHDGTRDAGQLIADLLAVNASRCVPPLPEGEVEKVAGSIFKRAQAKPSRDVSPEVLGKLDGIEDAYLWNRKWTGVGWKTPRSVMVVLIGEARKYGQTTKDGVRVSISVRMLALASGVRTSALTRRNGALNKLEEANIIRRVKGKKSGAYVLIEPSVARRTHSSTDAAAPSSEFTLPHPPTAPRLRYSKPVYETIDGDRIYSHHVLRLGKAAENVVDILERAGGWMSVPELGVALGIKHHRDLRRRTLPRLKETEVVECSGDDVRLRLDWSASLERKREMDGENADYQRDKKKYAEESKVYALKLEACKLHRVGVSLEEIAATLEIGTEDVRRLLDIERPAEPEPAPVEPDGFIEDLERVEDPTEPDTPVRKSRSSPKIEVIEGPIHSLSCECDDCLFPEPRYARLWRSPRVVVAA